MSEPNPNDPTKPQAPSQGAASSAAVRPATQPVSGMMAQSGIMVGSAGYPDMTSQQAGSPRPVAPQQVKARVTSAFLYVKSVEKSIEFYTEALGGAVTQKHADDPKGPLTLAIVRMGDFSLMLHFADDTDADLKDNRWGVGIHLQMRVSSADFAYDRACDAGYHARVSDGPIDQEWGWREFAIKDPDGYIWSIYEDKSNGAWT